MVAKTEDDAEKKVVQVKAKTGAWWKSTEKTEAASDGEPVAPAGEPEKKKPKRSPRKAAKKKAAEPVLDATIAETVEAAPGESAEGIAQNRQAAEKAGRKRPPRNRKGSRRKEAKPAADQAFEEAKPAEVRAVAEVKTAEDRISGETKPPKEQVVAAPAAFTPKDLPVGELSESAVPEAQAVEQIPAPEDDKNLRERRKGRGSRGRRGKRGGKKQSSGEEVLVKSDSVESVPVESEAFPDRPLPARAEEDEDFGDYFHEEDLPEELEEEEAVEVEEPQPEVKRVCKLLINAEEPEECRLALLEDGRLESIHVSTISRTQTKNNIYKAKIVAIEPSLQAAFVDYGTEKNGFLPFSEIHPEYYKQDLSSEVRHLVETHQWKKLSITDVIERGQEVLAQVVKEEVGKKGANMTTYLSIPGRCVVLMPGSDSSGISRKISGEERRSQLRGAMASIDMPEGIGWIVRTASVDINEEVLSRDVNYLLSLWEEIKRKGQEMDGFGLVYEDQESVLRFLREHFDPSIQEILVDDRTALEQVKKFVDLLPENQRNVKVRLHQGARPIFNQYSIEDQIESIYQPQVNLPSGGSIVISPTEALVAIDVNSGSTSRGKNFEASIFQANMEAASELARQLRLRDLGGLIVVDFIDMRNRKHIQAVEKKVREAMKKDKAKVDFSRISKFGLMQISRQKLGAPIEAGNYRQCEHCKGRGTVRSVETLSLYYLRRIQTGASRKVVGRVECHFPIDVASYLQNNKRAELYEMEKRYNAEISIYAEPDMKPMDNELIFHKGEKEESPKKQA